MQLQQHVQVFTACSSASQGTASGNLGLLSEHLEAWVLAAPRSLNFGKFRSLGAFSVSRLKPTIRIKDFWCPKTTKRPLRLELRCPPENGPGSSKTFRAVSSRPFCFEPLSSRRCGSFPPIHPDSLLRARSFRAALLFRAAFEPPSSRFEPPSSRFEPGPNPAQFAENTSSALKRAQIAPAPQSVYRPPIWAPKWGLRTPPSKRTQAAQKTQKPFPALLSFWPPRPRATLAGPSRSAL